MSLTGLQNTAAFQNELPEGSPKYQNFLTYSNTGLHSFTNTCKE